MEFCGLVRDAGSRRAALAALARVGLVALLSTATSSSKRCHTALCDFSLSREPELCKHASATISPSTFSRAQPYLHLATARAGVSPSH